MKRSTGVRSLTLLACLVLVVGAAAPAAGAFTSVEVDAALPDESETDQLSFTFTADANATVDATEQITRANGDVTFEFASWERTDGSGSGMATSWDVVAGGTYEVTYDVSVMGSVDQGSYGGTATVQTQSGGTVASEPLEVSVDKLYPEFGYVDPSTKELVYQDPDAQSESTSFDVQVPNDGQGAMVLSDVSFSGLPSGLSAEADLPGTIDGGSSGAVDVTVTGGDSIEPGQYSFQMTLTDNLGNTEEVSVPIEVRRPPIASVSGSEIEVGDVLNGTDREVEFTIEEAGGYEGIDGLSVTTIGSEQSASLSISGTRYLSTGPGGSATATASVSVDENVGQHEDLSWDVELTPDDQDAPSTVVTVSARSIYPAILEDVSFAETQLEFDEPRSSVTSFDTTTAVDIRNSGDLEMNVVSTSASMRSGEEYISASVDEAPATVAGLSTGEAVLDISADPDTPEGTYDVAVTVDTESAGTMTVVETVTITQEPELAAQTEVSYGELTITANQTRTIDIQERLGYEAIEGLEITKVSGPDRWLTVVERPPSRIESGDSSPFIVAVQFDTEAELYEQYRWTFRIAGENVEVRNITVTARARPYSFDQITNPLEERAGGGDWQAATTGPMNTMLLDLEERLRGDSDLSNSVLSRALAAGRATLLFVDSLEQARAAQDSGNYSAAQRSLARAAAARDQMRQYVGGIGQDELRNTGSESVTAAETAFDETASIQQTHYREMLEENSSIYRNAQAYRALMRLSEYTGDQESAAAREEAYQRASEEYLRTVESAAANRTAGDEAYEGYAANATIVLVDYPLVLNPARLDEVGTTTSLITTRYDTAVDLYERAGATEERDATQQRANTIGQRLQVSQYGLYGATGVYGLGVLALLGRTGLNLYAYYRDVTASASGDFLLDGG